MTRSIPCPQCFGKVLYAQEMRRDGTCDFCHSFDGGLTFARAVEIGWAPEFTQPEAVPAEWMPFLEVA